MAFFKVLSVISSALVVSIPDILDTGIQLYNIKKISELNDIAIFSSPPNKGEKGNKFDFIKFEIVYNVTLIKNQ